MTEDSLPSGVSDPWQRSNLSTETPNGDLLLGRPRVGDDTSLDFYSFLWFGSSVQSGHFHLRMNKVLCLSACFGPSGSGDPLLESSHSYPMIRSDGL